MSCRRVGANPPALAAPRIRDCHEDLREWIFDGFGGTKLDYVFFMFLSPPEAYEYCLKQAARELGGGVPGSRSVGTEMVDIPDVGYDREFREPGNPSTSEG